MTVFNSYSIGTVSVGAGATTVVGVGTLWSGINARPGDDIVIAGHTVVVMDVVDTTHITIDAWPYAAVAAGSAYKIIWRSPLRYAGGQAMADVDSMIASLSNPIFTGTVIAPTIAGGSLAASTLVLESTSGAGTTDYLSLRTGAQKERIRIDTNGSVIINISGTAYAAPNATHPVAIIGTTADCVLGFWAWGSANAPGTISMNYTPSNTSHLTHSPTQANYWLGLIGANGSDGATFQEGARIIFVADGNFSVGSSPGRLIFATVPSGSNMWLERMRIDKDGRVNIGNQAAIVGSYMLQISDTNATGALDIITNGGAFAGSSFLNFSKSRSTSPSGVTAVVSGDFLGFISFRGANGTDLQQAAYIAGMSDGTPSGTSMPGRLILATTPAGSNGSTERMRIDNKGNVIVNTAAIATSATDGFLYVPTCAGTPTGTPTTYTGRAPIVVNTTNNKLYFYSGGAWRDAGP
jgi:hypothetical protein